MSDSLYSYGYAPIPYNLIRGGRVYTVLTLLLKIYSRRFVMKTIRRVTLVKVKVLGTHGREIVNLHEDNRLLERYPGWWSVSALCNVEKHFPSGGGLQDEPWLVDIISKDFLGLLIDLLAQGRSHLLTTGKKTISAFVRWCVYFQQHCQGARSWTKIIYTWKLRNKCFHPNV